MNGHEQNSAPTELPMPIAEQTVDNLLVNPLEGAQETLVTQQLEQGVSSSPPLQVTAPHTGSSSVPAMQTVDDSSPQTTIVQMAPQIADDTDLIEKEWVDKAKQIVEQTKHDPHQQNKEMNNMKADYLKKRYNKDIKQAG